MKLFSEHVEDIVLLIFQYLNMLKKEGIKKWIFKECQVIQSWITSKFQCSS